MTAAYGSARFFCVASVFFFLPLFEYFNHVGNQWKNIVNSMLKKNKINETVNRLQKDFKFNIFQICVDYIAEKLVQFFGYTCD